MQDSSYHHRNPGETDLQWLARLNDERGQFFFTRDTLAFFGSTDRRAKWLGGAEGGFLYSERQENAPEGCSQWRAWVFDADGLQSPGVPSAAGDTRRRAELAVLEAAKAARDSV